MHIQYEHIIDLSHPISSDMPHWPGDPRTELKKVSDLERDGYHLHHLLIGEHSGTHIGWPSHFGFPGQNRLNGPENLFIPAVRVTSDHTLHQACIQSWEAVNGTIPPQSVVLVQTGWDQFWDDQLVYMQGFPGIDPKAVEWLIDKRQIIGLGIDSPGIDAFDSKGHQANLNLARHGCFHLENLTNLRDLPEKGFVLFIGALNIKGGTGSPARVLAVI